MVGEEEMRFTVEGVPPEFRCAREDIDGEGKDKSQQQESIYSQNRTQASLRCHHRERLEFLLAGRGDVLSAFSMEGEDNLVTRKKGMVHVPRVQSRELRCSEVRADFWPRHGHPARH